MKDILDLAMIDLHLHLDGSLSTRVVLDIARHDGIILPTDDEVELEKLLKVDENSFDLNDYLKRFMIPGMVLSSKYGLDKAVKDLLKRMHEEGMKYIEIRMAPQLSTSKGLSQEEVVLTLIQSIKEAEELYDISSNLILCMMRGTINQKENRETIRLVDKYQSDKVVAIDLAGSEKDYPNELFKEEFDLVNRLNLNRTIHAGEASGPESVISALSYGTKRIGHGVRIIEDLNVISKAKGIYFEVCPKSNIDTHIYSNYENAPIRELSKYGIKVTINSDNLTVSSTSVRKQYEELVKIGYTYDELKSYTLNAVEASFATKEIKDKLRQYLD